jgi:hypothetical protein
MCEINPVHTSIFRLEAFTSDSSMTFEEFENLIAQKLLEVEVELNKDMRFRFHIHREKE